MMHPEDRQVSATAPIVSPQALRAALPATEAVETTVTRARDVIRRILRRQDPRLLVVVGPCSIHDPRAALEYAERLNEARIRYRDQLFLVMRTYFEKPRTTIGWRGFLNDPHLDGSFAMETGLRQGRELLLAITRMGLPVATEMLDPIASQYLADLVSWSAIGARTTESQTHRALASGLSMPVGFKNGTDGGLKIALDAIVSSSHRHSFFGVDDEGRCSVVQTAGNPDGHLVLRGGHSGPNYSARHIASAADQLRSAALVPSLMVDCSHANSGSDYREQESVWRSVVAQRAAGSQAIIGLMAESHLFAGKQSIPADLSALRYGVSITDACIDWETTERMLSHAHAALSAGATTEASFRVPELCFAAPANRQSAASA